MNANEFSKTLSKSQGLQLIVAGLGELVENEGYTPYEALQILSDVKRNTIQALNFIAKEGENE